MAERVRVLRCGAIRGVIDRPYRYALMRHHGLMHVVNAVAFRHLEGIITGVQIGATRSRIDFKLPGFSREGILEFERLVNDALGRATAVTSRAISEEEFLRRHHSRRDLGLPGAAASERIASERDRFIWTAIRSPWRTP